MTDKRTCSRSRQGFTLIEVLVAMVILAVGLLALGALTVGSSRMMARADRESQYTALATERLESVLQRIDLGQNPPSGQTNEEDGAVVATVVNRTTIAGTQNVFTVAVTVTPPAGQSWTLRPVTVVGRAFRSS